MHDPFSIFTGKASLLLKTKTHKTAPEKYDFFSHFTKLSKSLGSPVLLLTCKTFHTAPGTTQDLVANQLNFLLKETGEALLEQRMALTSVVAGKDVHIQKSRSTGLCSDHLYSEVGLRAHRHGVCVRAHMCVFNHTK